VKQVLVAVACGVVFATGLGISGMTDPAKVIGFLDVFGRWDPSLGFVMVGAIGVHLGAARWALRAARPLGANHFVLPSTNTVDARLVGGSALFGLGWGATGYCPGPALVDLVAPSQGLVTFVAAMLAGIAAFRFLATPAARDDEVPRSAPESAMGADRRAGSPTIAR
jgi:uncharacterized protein